MLREILVITGKPGLYRLITRGKNIIIVESLTDNKRMPVHLHDKIVSLDDIYFFTNKSKESVGEIFLKIQEKEKGKFVSIDYSKASPDELRAYLEEVLPDFDRERVYTDDIIKLLKWHDLLINNGIPFFN